MSHKKKVAQNTKNSLEAAVEAHHLWLFTKGRMGEQGFAELPANGFSFRKSNLSHFQHMRKSCFYGLDLSESFLNDMNLSDGSFTESDLTEANLNGTILFGADFTKAVLWKASLVAADLRSALFDYADLQNADLRSNLFKGASFICSDLRGAILPICDDTFDFSEVDFSGARRNDSDAKIPGWDLMSYTGQKRLIKSGSVGPYAHLYTRVPR